MVEILGRSFTKRQLAEHVGDFRQVFGVELMSLENGVERGNRVLRFRAGGGCEFDVLVDRAMDLAGLTIQGVPVGWHSPAGFKSPWLTEIEAEMQQELAKHKQAALKALKHHQQKLNKQFLLKQQKLTQNSKKLIALANKISQQKAEVEAARDSLRALLPESGD